MVFSSNIFLFYYLTIVLLIYYITPLKLRNLMLFLCNLVFYGWGEPVFIVLMLFSTVSDYIHGYYIDKYRQNKRLAKGLVISAIVINLALLGFFKYAGFFCDAIKAIFPSAQFATPQIPLPIGISFYTFQTMSYSIDVYRNDAPVQKNIISFGTYVTLFPQLIAGPIVRYQEVAEQIDHRKETVAQFAQGIRLFIVGLAKKLLIANQMGLLFELLLPDSGALSGWVGILAYTFQIYFDFSGYSDMARGLGNLFGFEFLKNFDYPYISKSITEFWRRWHISLSTWFREYVYIPLGGNRRGVPRQILNLLIVWGLTGLWHGASANFVCWGFYYAVLLILEKFVLKRALEKLPGGLQHLYAMFFVVMGWVLFYFEDMGAMGDFFSRLFSFGATSQEALSILVGYLPLMAVAVVASTPIAARVYERFRQKTATGYVGIVVLSGLFLLCVASLASQSYNPFIYFRF